MTVLGEHRIDPVAAANLLITDVAPAAAPGATGERA